ncbi:MAG: metal ABC transporter permease [SAR324 cluster bacterium]|nr:metal ABC transporter permease [SAR324 cluster bacterium]
MIEALQFDFMRHAIYAGLLAALICGMIGSLVVVKRIVFIAGGIAHAAYGGCGIAIYAGIPILISTLGFSVGITMLMAAITLRQKHRADTIIGILWAAGMAIGIILTDLTPGYQGELMGYLFGGILAVPGYEIYWMSTVSFVIFCLLTLFYRQFLALAYDEEFARVRGVEVDGLYLLLLLMIAVSVVVVIRVVGLILVLALLTIAPMIVERYVRSLAWMMFFSVLINLCFVIGGLWLSYSFNLTSGASIVLVGVAGYSVAQIPVFVNRFLK